MALSLIEVFGSPVNPGRTLNRFTASSSCFVSLDISLMIRCRCHIILIVLNTFPLFVLFSLFPAYLAIFASICCSVLAAFISGCITRGFWRLAQTSIAPPKASCRSVHQAPSRKSSAARICRGYTWQLALREPCIHPWHLSLPVRAKMYRIEVRLVGGLESVVNETDLS